MYQLYSYLLHLFEKDIQQLTKNVAFIHKLKDVSSVWVFIKGHLLITELGICNTPKDIASCSSDCGYPNAKH